MDACELGRREASPYETRFDDCFARHYVLVRTIALRITRSPSDADDIAQTVFLKLWAALPLLEHRRLKQWLAVVAKNATIDRLRRGRRELADGVCDETEAPYALSAELEAFVTIDSANVTSALAGLRCELREIILDSFVKGKSHRSIALERAIPLGTVKTRIRTGLIQLRRSLNASMSA